MSILGRIAELRSVENPGRPLTDASLIDVLGGQPTEAGVPVTPESAMSMTAVYRCIAIHAGVMGALPLHAYRTNGSTRERVSPSIIDDPHPEMTPFEVKEFLGQSLCSFGNAFALKQRDGLGRVREVEPLHPGLVSVQRRKEWKSELSPTGKRFEVDDGGKTTTYTPWDVLHIPGLSYDGIVGLSPIAVARQAIGLGLAAEQFGARLFSRGALIPGVLQTDQTFTDEAPARRLREQWRTKTAGPNNQWAIPVLDSGTKFVPIGLPPEDAQFLQTREFSVVEIARLYGIPPHLVGAVERSTSWGSGIEQQNLQMLTFTTDPLLVRFEQRVTKELVLDRRVYFRFARNAFLRTDTAARYLAYQRGINNGWLSADEIRALEEMDPLPDGKGGEFYRPGNLAVIGDDEPSAEPAAEGGAA